ncbi:cytochrome P450 [Phlebopus sp. FC_14]|nr:cytochrome P450 [Phlebopus sp. FC_14]
MTSLPPGLVALVRILPRLLLPPAAAYLSLQACCLFDFLKFPGPLRTLIYIGSVPVTFTVYVLYAWYRDGRQAALRGAVLPPQMAHERLGALDKLAALMRNFRSGYLAEFFEIECEKNGQTMNMRILCENRVFTTEPEYIKAMLVTQFNSFAKGDLLRDQLHSSLGTGVFNSDGDVWRFHRSMSRPFFSKDRVIDFENFEKHAEDAVNQTKARLREGYPIDFQDMVSRFTLDSATTFLFGKDVCSLSAGLVYPPSSPLSKDPKITNHPANLFADAFAAALIASATRAHFGHLWRLIGGEFWEDRVQKHMRVCFEFIDPLLQHALAKKEALKSRGALGDEKGNMEAQERESLLEHLVKYTDDRKVLRDESLNIMIAGRDTTAATLTFAIYMLSQHPDVLARLREEILTKLGSSRRPTHDDMKDMKYLRAVINETLRLYPPVPLNVRTSTEGTVWPPVNDGSSFYIPPGTSTAYSVFLMQRRKDLWGPDADIFDPDRFIDERLHKYLTPNPFIFLPFNAGPRICLGQQFAYNEVSYFLIRLLQSFSSVSLDMETQHMPPADWAQAKGRKAVEKVVMRSHLTMYVENGLWVKMTEACDAESA